MAYNLSPPTLSGLALRREALRAVGEGSSYRSPFLHTSKVVGTVRWEFLRTGVRHGKYCIVLLCCILHARPRWGRGANCRPVLSLRGVMRYCAVLCWAVG